MRKVTASHGAQNQNSLLETKLYGFVWKFNLRSIKRLKGTRRVSVSRNPPVARLSINCLTRTMASSEFGFVRVKTSLQCVYPIIADFPCWLRAVLCEAELAQLDRAKDMNCHKIFVWLLCFI